MMTDEEFEVAKALTKLSKKEEMRLKPDPLNNQMITKECTKGGTIDPINTKITMRVIRALLDSAEYDHILAWTEDGKAFVIKDQDEFVRRILHNHLNGGKYSSFIRKLYRWGFRSIALHTFHNKNFQRGYYDRSSKLKRYGNTFTQASPKKKVRFLEPTQRETCFDAGRATSFVADSIRLPMMNQQELRSPTTSRMSVVNKIIRDSVLPRHRYYDDLVNHHSDSCPSPSVFGKNRSSMITSLQPSRSYTDIDSSSVISSSSRSNRLSSYHDKIMEDAMTTLVNDRLEKKEAVRYKTELLRQQVLFRKQVLLRKQADLENQRMKRTLAIQEWLSKKNESIFETRMLSSV